MDAEALSTFLAIHRQGGFSSAARLLRRTQPAVSRRIKLLEDELGVPLFERLSGGPVLSQAGRVLVPYAERVLAAMQDAGDAVRALATGNAGLVSLAVVGTLADAKLTVVLKRFALRHGGVDFRLQTARSVEVGDLVRRGEATIGLRYDHDRSPDLNSELLTSEPLIVVCAKDHAIAGRSIKALAQLRSERWLAFPEVPARRELSAAHVFAIFRTHGLGEIDWVPVDSLSAQKRLVEAGFGLALLPRSAASEELDRGTMSAIRVQDLHAGQDITAVTRRGGFLSAAAARLLELLRAGYASEAPSPPSKKSKRR